MRQLAFYGATPSNMKVSRLEAIKNPSKRIIERQKIDSDLPEDKIIKALPIAPQEVIMPEIPAAYSYLRELYYSCGQAKSTGMGLVSLDYTDIRNWRKELKLDLYVWEREIVKKMSEAYCNEIALATDPYCEAPYKPEEEIEVDKVAVAIDFMAQMAEMKARQRVK